MSAPAVRSAQAQSPTPPRSEARAARADRLPQVSAGIDAGRYGVFENDRDYDIRGRVGAALAAVRRRRRRAPTRPRPAPAPPTPAPTRIREEAERDAAIAWSDVRALEEQLEALEAAYIASRRSRDVIVERFRVARGTLFDVVAAEDAYFESRHRLHPGADRIGRRALRAAIAHGPAARRARDRRRPAAEVKDERRQSHQDARSRGSPTG